MRWALGNATSTARTASTSKRLHSCWVHIASRDPDQSHSPAASSTTTQHHATPHYTTSVGKARHTSTRLLCRIAVTISVLSRSLQICRPGRQPDVTLQVNRSPRGGTLPDGPVYWGPVTLPQGCSAEGIYVSPASARPSPQPFRRARLTTTTRQPQPPYAMLLQVSKTAPF